ncbi:MAG TPA: hypothetical protein VFW37_07380 [Alphaproteobacteria bacterium]|nr:hypothetical protein [Alphaproteobacteria bacterium]
MKRQGVLIALMAVIITAITVTASYASDAKPRFISGDNYNASQFSAPGLQSSFTETIRMLIGSNVDAHKAAPAHDSGHGEAAVHGLLHSYDQVSCSSFCRTVPGGLDQESNEAYEACLGPCFKCAQVSIRAQAEAGSTAAGQAAFQACYAK